MATKREQADMLLVYNALFTLAHQTDYQIAWKNCEYMCDPEDIRQVAAAIFSAWTEDKLYQALAISDDEVAE